LISVKQEWVLACEEAKVPRSACEAGDSVEPGARAPSIVRKTIRAREAGDSRSTAARFAGSIFILICSWGLRPRLYAAACFAG